MASLKEFMGEQRVIDRWFVLRTGIYGAFLGALLAVSFVIVFGLSYP